jgi:hypothetical protein
MEKNRIGGVMDSEFASSVVDREFENRLGQAKDYKLTPPDKVFSYIMARTS